MLYTVKPGDTLSAIARDYLGDSARYMEIAKLNGLKNPDLIQPGQKLQLPWRTPKESFPFLKRLFGRAFK